MFTIRFPSGTATGEVQGLVDEVWWWLMDGWVVMAVYVLCSESGMCSTSFQINRQIAGITLSVGDTSVTLNSVELSQNAQIE